LERKCAPRVAARSPFRNHQDGVPPGTPNADVSRRIPLHGAWFDKLTNRSRNQQDGVPAGTPEEHASVPIPLHGANSTQVKTEGGNPQKGARSHNPLTRGELNSSHRSCRGPARFRNGVTIPLHGANSTQDPRRRDGPTRRGIDRVPVTIPLHGANSTQAIPGPATRRFRHRSQSLQPFRLPTRGVVRQAHQPFP